MKKRTYKLKQRAEKQQDTRERIVDAAMALHEDPGPAETTISALAERAGVQRLTVYRHFPTDQDLFAACSSKWLGLHPPPDVSSITDRNRSRHAHLTLAAVYRYYGNTAKMWKAIYRDLEKVPALKEPVAGFEAYLSGVRESLLADWGPQRSRRLRATVGHALQFSTWQSLRKEGLSVKTMAALACSWADAAADRIGSVQALGPAGNQ